MIQELSWIVHLVLVDSYIFTFIIFNIFSYLILIFVFICYDSGARPVISYCFFYSSPYIFPVIKAMRWFHQTIFTIMSLFFGISFNNTVLKSSSFHQFIIHCQHFVIKFYFVRKSSDDFFFMTDSWHSMLNYIKYIIIHFLTSFHIVVMGKLFLIVMLKLLFL